jgi:hypothetical protein
MKVDKFSISLDPDLGDDVRRAAKRSGMPVSTWVAEAAASRLRQEAFAEFIALWEGEHGEFTAEEMAEARADLGIPEAKPA